LNENDIENNKIIKLIINGDVKKIIIDNLRKKDTNPDENIDITIIQIKFIFKNLAQILKGD